MSASHDDGLDDDDGGHGGGHDHGRWAVPYGDMLTVLMALFIVLYAMSSVDEGKYEALAASLADGFNSPIEVVLDSPDPGAPEEKPVEEMSPYEEALAEISDLAALKEAVESDLEAKGLAEGIEYEIDDRGLTFKLLGTDTFFESNSAILTGKANAVISTITPRLASDTRDVSVEGHADARAAAFPYETNWDLASARATTVLRYISEVGGVSGVRLSATSFGDAHPAVSGATNAAYSANRRVDLVVLSDASEEAKALIPGVIKGAKSAEEAAPPKEKKKEASGGH